MYNALQYGNNWDGYNIQDLNTSLSRMSAIGAISLTIPGPKMIWHFSDLGMENSFLLAAMELLMSQTVNWILNHSHSGMIIGLKM